MSGAWIQAQRHLSLGPELLVLSHHTTPYVNRDKGKGLRHVTQDNMKQTTEQSAWSGNVRSFIRKLAIKDYKDQVQTSFSSML